MSENIGMGECCLSGHIHEHAKPTGRVETIGGLQVYVAEPKTGSTEKSIIFITDSIRPPFSISLPRQLTNR